jgi:hypothetical protein
MDDPDGYYSTFGNSGCLTALFGVLITLCLIAGIIISFSR